MADWDAQLDAREAGDRPGYGPAADQVSKAEADANAAQTAGFPVPAAAPPAPTSIEELADRLDALSDDEKVELSRLLHGS